MQDSYDKSFGIAPAEIAKNRRALACALDIRKFEIELYWKRTTYFWTLITAVLASYFVVLNSTTLEDKNYLAFIVGCVGIIFTWAWSLANQGSKFWQENWENHVDMLEDNVMGPLYKTILCRPKTPGEGGSTIEYLIAPRPISVSRLNQIITLFMLVIWCILEGRLVPPFSCIFQIEAKYAYAIYVTLFFAFFLKYGSTTHLGDHKHRMSVRKTEIIDQDPTQL